MTAVLSTVRLQLRPLASTDTTDVFAMMSDPETMRFWDSPPFDSPETVARVVAGQLAQVAEGSALYWAVRLDRDGRALGVCDLSDIDLHHGRAETGFLFARPYWGKGYAREAMAAILSHAFGPLGLERLWARIHAGNDASRTLLSRLGFTQEGVLRGHILRDGGRRDCEIWGRSH